jgi:hypothetical protein
MIKPQRENEEKEPRLQVRAVFLQTDMSFCITERQANG